MQVIGLVLATLGASSAESPNLVANPSFADPPAPGHGVSPARGEPAPTSTLSTPSPPYFGPPRTAACAPPLLAPARRPTLARPHPSVQGASPPTHMKIPRLQDGPATQRSFVAALPALSSTAAPLPPRRSAYSSSPGAGWTTRTRAGAARPFRPRCLAAGTASARRSPGRRRRV